MSPEHQAGLIILIVIVVAIISAILGYRTMTAEQISTLIASSEHIAAAMPQGTVTIHTEDGSAVQIRVYRRTPADRGGVIWADSDGAMYPHSLD